MRLSSSGIKLLKSIEQLRLVPYDDQTGAPVYQWTRGATVGFGHLLTPSEWPFVAGGITRLTADLLFNADLSPFEQLITRLVWPVPQHQFDALVTLAYNIGADNFTRSSIVKMIRDPQAEVSYPSKEAAWKAWNKSQGAVNKGLINRRAAEWTLYTTGDYVTW